jgi:uncharacterized protein (DUF3820 family)
MSRHGRATIPFGKYKGVRIRLLPDDYLSWLTTAAMMRDPKWKWLYDSLIAELKFRGLNWEMAATEDPAVEIPDEVPPILVNSRKIKLERVNAEEEARPI